MTELSKTVVSKLCINTFYNAKTRSSFCWKYFGNLIVTDGKKKKILNSDQVYCLACLSAVKNESEEITFGCAKIKGYNKTVSTGNLTRHLRDDHNIRDELGSANSSTNSSRRDKWQLATDLVLWFCKSLLPFDAVSDDGMVDFFKKYNIIVTNKDIPSPHTVNNSALSDVYESMLSKVMETISIDAASHFAIASDLWTDKHRRIDYITLTLQYLTFDFVLKAVTLSTEVIDEKKTAEKIRDTIENVKYRFALNDKKIVVVTNAGENVHRAVSLTDMAHHLCLGHGLHNLVTVDGIKSVPEIAALVQKCKKIVKAVRYRALELQVDARTVQLEFLESLDRVVEAIESDEGDPITQDELTTPADPLIKTEDHISPSISEDQHIQTIETVTPTRWHVILEMFQSMIHVCKRDRINNMLRKIEQDDLKVSQREWILLEGLVKFLRSFREAVEIMSSQKTCTLNIALVFRSEIVDILNTYQDGESLILLSLKRNMLANIDKRMPVSRAMVAAALLDYRFMSLNEVDIFLEKLSTTRTTFLSSYIKDTINISNISETSTNPTSSIKKEEENISLLHKLSKKHSVNACEGIQEDPVDQECWRYLASADPMALKNGNLLSFWNAKKEAFPHLSALARAVLCVPATSISSETMFSVAGLTIAAKRSRLEPNRVNKIIFIHDNYKLCNM